MSMQMASQPRLRRMSGTLLCVALTLFAPAVLAIERVADRAPQADIRVELQWGNRPGGGAARLGRRAGPLDADDAFHQMSAVIPLVEHRLDLRRWTGKQVRIWYVVPPDVIGVTSSRGLLVQWEGGQWLGNGQARPGDRVMLFSGVVSAAELVERLRLTLTVDSRQFTGQLRYSPVFELEVQ